MMVTESITLNVLFLGGAKRVSFGRKLIEAAERRGLNLKIFSYELDLEVPVAAIGEVIPGRKWTAPDLLEHLHDVVDSYKIDVLLPFVDGAVGVAGLYMETYGDVWAPVVDPSMAERLFDKVESAKIFEKHGIPVPLTISADCELLPLIAKPRHGSASKGIKVIENAKDFRKIQECADDYLIQEYIRNRIEYTVDCYISMSGEVVCVSPRVRLEVIGGEVSKTMTVADEEILLASRMVIESLNLRGAVTLQFLRDKDTGRLMLMEINPRLGGGVVCSIHAGADIPGMIVEEAMGKIPAPATEIKPGTLICRYFEEVVFNK
ncbi:MAG: ATP-grasp domain-containing protein [Duncaniella sp.]|nr:ATP-grasp domain-containing protein [Duncaniella sp.]